jgi:hypothetical protein
MLQEPILHFIKYLSIVLLSGLIFNVIGIFLSNFLKIRLITKESMFFSNILIGTIATISIYAIIKTSFLSTFLWVLILFFILYFYNKKKKETFLEENNLSIKIISFLVLILFFSISFYLTYYFSNGNVFGDNLFYANVAQNIIDTGIETNDLDWTVKEKTPLPYHYFEAWFIAFFTEIFSLNTIAVYGLIYVPFSLSLIFIGTISIIKSIYKEKKVTIINLIFLAFLFIFLQIPSNPFSETTPFLNLFLIGNVIYHIKYAIVYLIFQLSFILVLEKKYYTAFIFILMVVPLYSTIAPAILSGLFFVLLFVLFSKKISKKLFFNYFSWLILTTLYYGLFYYFQKSKSSTHILDYSKLTESYVKIGKISIIILLIILIFSGILFYIYKNNYFNLKKQIWINLFKSNQLVIGFLAFLFGSFLMVFLLFPIVNAVSHDAFQLLSNFLTPIYSLVLFIIILILLKNKTQKVITIFTVIFLGYFIIISNKNQPFSINYIILPKEEKNIDLEYYHFIKNNINEKSKFAYFRDYSNKSVMYAKPFLFLPDSRIAHFTNHYVSIGLSCYDLPKGKDIRYVNKEVFSFYKFVENQKKNNTFANLNKSILEFLKHYKIKYLIVEKSSKYTLNLDSISLKSIKNKYNNNTFYILK